MEDQDTPVVEVQHHSYQPTKAELEEDVSIEATPEEVAKALMRRVKVKEVKEK